MWPVYVTLVPALFYFGLIGAAAVGFSRTARQAPGWRGTLPSVSVIIPARNEEDAVAACLNAVLRNDYPMERVEIIVVDDGSEDETADLVRAYERASTGSPSIRLLQSGQDPLRGRAHKKAALAMGVHAASGDLVLTIDADCLAGWQWIRTMVDAFDEETGMVTGPVVYRPTASVLGRLQALEFLGLVALGGGLVEIGRPHLCNSANLAYRRRVFHEVGGYEGLEHVSTGDDEMLMHRIAYESGWTVRTCMRAAAAVETDASETVAELYRQRKRWASAHARYPHLSLRLVSALCYAFYLALVGLAAAALIVPWLAGIAGLLFGLKVAVEAAILIPAARRFERRNLLALLPLAEIVQPIYVLIVGMAGTFGGYEWKGRRVPA